MPKSADEVQPQVVAKEALPYIHIIDVSVSINFSYLKTKVSTTTAFFTEKSAPKK
jgi:hypothetical protein